MMKKLSIAVFFGGRSSEYKVSLESAYSVIRNLDSEKYRAVPIGISPDGRWYYYTGNIEKIYKDQWLNGEDCIPAALSPNFGARTLLIFRGERMEKLFLDAALPVMHGKYGEDGCIQGLLELTGIPLIGCSVLAAALCMDKDRAHKLAYLAGIDVPKAFTVCSSYDKEVLLEEAKRIGYPLFVKPVKAGSSFGITKVLRESDLAAAAACAFAYDGEVIIEENIPGFEVGCAIMGTDRLTVGEVDEIELSGGFFDYTEKYTLKTSAIHVLARIDKATAGRIKETAVTLYRALGCSGFARVDMFLTPEGRIVFNEINTIPGFTEHSRFPGMMKAAGILFPQILDTIIEQAVMSK